MKSPGMLRSQRGFTLVELTVTISMLMILVGVVVAVGIGPYTAYSNGRQAGEALRAVKAAQLMYLADNPTTAVSALQQAQLQPYLPNGAWPTLPKVGSQQPTINYTVFPPVAVLNGSTYTPSGSSTDGLWNVGQY